MIANLSPSPRPPSPPSFRKTFCWVVVAHILLIAGLVYIRWTSHPQVTPPLMEMLSPEAIASASPRSKISPASPIKPPSPAHPTPPRPKPEATSPPPPIPTPPTAVPRPKIEAPVIKSPSPSPSEIQVAEETPPPAKKETPKKPVKTEKPPTPKSPPEPIPPTPKPTKPSTKKNKIVPNMTETTAPDESNSKPSPSASTKSSSTAHPDATPSNEGASEGEINSKLASALTHSGATASIGKLTVSSSGGPSEFGWYYQLIGDQMHQVWDQPKDLAGLKLRTQIRIRVSSDGSVSEAEILSGSGNATYDQSALAAARAVHHLSKGRPEGCPELITINFRLAD